MPSPRLDSMLTEYLFTEAEANFAKSLTPLQVMWFQTKYALLFKEKASSLVPETSTEDRSFLMRVSELEGKLGMIQEILDDAATASKQAIEASAASAASGNSVSESNQTALVEIKDLSQRANSQVHDA